MTIPGFSSEEQHAAPIKKSAATEAHKQVQSNYGNISKKNDLVSLNLSPFAAHQSVEEIKEIIMN